MTDNQIIFESTKMFSVPTEIVDRHLDAPEKELKCLLFLLRHVNSVFMKPDILNSLDMSEQELEDCLRFWVKRGVLFKSAGKYSLTRPNVKASDVMVYSASDVAKRLDSDDGLKFLYDKTEQILAKPLTSSDASCILSLVDYAGLPTEVMALLLQYCAREGKVTLRQIEKTGFDWADRQIFTYEKAEAYIAAEQEKKSAERRIAAVIGITGRGLTDAEKKAFASWTEQGYGADMVRIAYDQTVRLTGKYSYQYMDKIIAGWAAKGIKNVAEAEKDTASPAKNSRPAAASGKKKRYDSKIVIDSAQTEDLSWKILKQEFGED